MNQKVRDTLTALAILLVAPALILAIEDPSVSRPSGAGAKTAGQRATIRDVRREILDDVVRITIELDAEVPFHDERIDNPARVFVDLRTTRAAPPFTDKTLRFDGDSAPVRQIRLGRHPDGTTRVVLEAADVAAYNIYQLYNPYRLVIDCARAARPAPALDVRHTELMVPQSVAPTTGLPIAPLTRRRLLTTVKPLQLA